MTDVEYKRNYYFLRTAREMKFLTWTEWKSIIDAKYLIRAGTKGYRNG